MKNILHVVCISLFMGLFAACTQQGISPRETQSFNKTWKFQLGDNPQAAQLSFDDSEWRTLNLPHDWAIEGDFDEHNPSGQGGGALPGGIGWYRKTFDVAEADSSKLFHILFDGVYMNSEVFINGHSLGTRPYGYISFEYDLTPYLNWGGKNTVAVKVDNSDQPNSRWYSGCGIYRNVWLIKTNAIHVSQWGTYVTSEVQNNDATLNIEITLENETKKDTVVTVKSIVKDADNKEVARDEKEVSLKAGEKKTISNRPIVRQMRQWDISDPYLYKIENQIVSNNTCIDTYCTNTGIRTFRFDTQKGFFLNEKPVKINGVCMHHDLGCLGAAVNTRAIERQLEILKEMGCNGIRTSHNPPAPELLDLCDRMGFIVMDEAFDMWRKRKTAHDYARYFDEWHERDLHDFIVRDRNHPSIFMWSIGNEVLEQWSDAKADTLSLEEANLILNLGQSSDMLAHEGEMSVNSLLTKKLADIVRSLDPTRPITAGCNETNPNSHLFKSGALDIIGFNYHNWDVPGVPQNFPDKPFLITESNSALATRGYYRMPSDSNFVWPYYDRPFSDPSFACSSYDNCYVPWGSNSEWTLKLINEHEYISGQYIWTGFDYIGEPTPYGWPARSSYFGIIDLAGFPKDAYYLHQAEWTDKPVLHLFPHWNWEEGQQIDMWCYYNNADEVELFINGKSQGVTSKTKDKLHAAWRVAFEPGTVKVIARKGGEVVGEKEIHTAGEPAQIRLTPDRAQLKADGYDLSFITVEVLDKDGNLCPNAENLIRFDIEGRGFIAGVDNGNPTSMERFKDTKRKAFYGKCLVVVQNDGTSGNTELTATSDGLQPASVRISAR